MTVPTTRMLLLGAVALFEPVNGYQIRRELISWRVDEWAHVNPGSIYAGLATLTRHGLLQRHDLVDGRRAVAVYELTEAGRAEFHRELVQALEEVDLHDRVAFQAAFGMLPRLERGLAVAALERRRTALATQIELFVAGQDDPANGPPHARRGWTLWLDLARAEAAWLDETLRQITSGELRFAPDEDWDWVPPDDDPGWQMNVDRDKYRAMLGR
ncbi:PadR family transcriptional regulator [Nocardioides sp. LHG3406-4]|uniref:PadR family transcriptional regulator n=1 Tax=Nocardioides sp. LHG3406-4 TaxID=2804575 RepID=UPI003CFAFF23